MNTWQHKDWKSFKGTWFIVGKLTDDQIIALIEASPHKYGDLLDWNKVK